MSGCYGGGAEENYLPEHYVEPPKSVFSAASSKPASSDAPVIISSVPALVSETPLSETPLSETPELNRDIEKSSGVDGDELFYLIRNVFSEGEYYDIEFRGEKIPSDNAVYVNGEPYGNFTARLYSDGVLLDTLPLNVPGGERFLLMESAAESLEYGCEAISNMRDFDAAEYPDVLEIDFHSSTLEIAVPTYARFFTVFGGKLAELPIYQGGEKAEPRGIKLEPKSAGLAIQYLTVNKVYNTDEYEIIKYEYRFNLEEKRLDRKQVKFLGWED